MYYNNSHKHGRATSKSQQASSSHRHAALPPPQKLSQPPSSFPHSPPSLPEIVLKQVGEGWKALSTTINQKFLTISIPDNYQTEEGPFPFPFPKLANLFEKIDTGVSTEDEYHSNYEDYDYGDETNLILERSHSFCRNTTRSSSTLVSASRSQSQPSSPHYCHNSRDISNGGNGRPSSAPPQPQSTILKSRKVFTQSPSSSIPGTSRYLQRSKIQVQNIPDELDFNQHGHQQILKQCQSPTLPLLVSRQPPSNQDSVQAIHQRRQQQNQNNQSRLRSSSNDNSTSSISSQWSGGGGMDNNYDDVEDYSYSGSQSTLKLLKSGKTLVEHTNNKSSPRNLHEVANNVNTLHGLVMSQLHTLQQENEMLKVENMKLKEQISMSGSETSTSIKNVKGTTLQRITASPVQCLKVPGDYPRLSQSSISSTSQKTSNSNDLAKGDVIIQRLQVLEDCVTGLLDQTSLLQDRLYNQEIRYEDTLGKFEDIVSSLTSTYAIILQQPSTTNNNQGITLSETLSQLNQATEQLASITKSNSKRVQFKGILKK